MEINKGVYKFYYGLEEDPLGQLKYKVNYNTFYIEQISIDKKLKGKGVSAALCEAAIAFAKEKGYDINIQACII